MNDIGALVREAHVRQQADVDPWAGEESRDGVWLMSPFCTHERGAGTVYQAQAMDEAMMAYWDETGMLPISGLAG